MPIDMCIHTYTRTQTHLNISEGPTQMSYVYGLGQLGKTLLALSMKMVHFGFM